MMIFRLLASTWLAAGFLQNVAAQEISPALAPTLKASSDLLQQGKAKEALAKLNGLNSANNANDQYIIARLRAAAAQRSGDNALAAQSLEIAFASGKVPEAERAKLAESLASAYAQVHNYAKASQWLQKAQANGNNSSSAKELQAYLQAQSGDYNAIAREAAGAIQAAESANHRPSEDALLSLNDAYSHTGNKTGQSQVLEKLITHYPKKEYWAIYLAQVQTKPGFNNRYALDVLRLRLATGNLTQSQDFMEMAQLALQAGLPAEGKAVIDKAYAAHIFGTGAEAPRQQRLRELAVKSDAQAKASLPNRAREATTAKDGMALIKIGSELTSMGQFGPAITTLQQGIAKGGLKHPEEAKLRLGMAMIQSGKDHAGAVKILKSVQGNDGAAEIARIWATVIPST